ncbi:hypothetical protein TNCV_5014811 [Trichonephila clavipes]|nr:hypothetical protein TNCV_5014811 [Trichonephila clavipes]
MARSRLICLTATLHGMIPGMLRNFCLINVSVPLPHSSQRNCGICDPAFLCDPKSSTHPGFQFKPGAQRLEPTDKYRNIEPSHDAEDCGFQILNDDEIVTSVQEEYDPVDD